MSNQVALNKQKVYLTVCAVLLCLFSFAQQHCSITNIPFEGGEKITYDIYYNWHFIWTHAGEVYFKVDSTTFYKKKFFIFTAMELRIKNTIGFLRFAIRTNPMPIFIP